MPERSRRRPLVLASTKSLANSLLGASLNLRPTNQPSRSSSITPLSTDDSSPCLELRAGLLRFPDGNSVKFDFKHTGRDLDNSALVGLPICTLKRLAIVSGSLVLLKNVQMNLQRVAQVVALDSPTSRVGSSEVEAESSGSPVVMKVLPSIDLYTNCQHIQLDEGYAYLSPLLAFNAGVHTSSFISLRSSGRDALASLFDIDNEQASGEGNINCIVNLRLEPWPQFPRYASHLRVSFVKVPECGIIEFLRGKSSTEAKCRQDMIDTALNDYFSVDRYLSKGDVFCIEINWSCNSDICYRCRRRKQKSADDIIHFLVVALDPSEEQILRVNRNQTAFILGGSIPSAVPPAFLVPQPTNVVPVRVEMIKTLASILIPSMSPFLLSSEFKVTLLLHGLAGSGKRTLVKYVAQLLGLHVVEYSCHSLMESSEKKASAALAQAFNTADRYSPAILLLHHFDVFRNVASPEGSQSDQAGLASDIASVIRESTDPVKVHGDIFKEGKSNGGHESMGGETINRHKVLLIAALDNPEGLPPNIRRCFSHEIGVDPLTEDQRATILSQFLQRIPEVSTNVGVEDLVRDMAAQTSGFLPRDLRALMAEAGVNLTLKSNNPVIARDEEDPNPTDVQKELVEQAPQIHSNEGLRNALTASLDQMKKRSAAALGTPKVPDVKWEDVGGLEDVKKAILDTIQLPLVHKELFSSGLRKRSGVLLYGPPGTGKTLLAKAVATECSLNFLSVKGPEVINMYIGQSESNIREIFEKAGNARPCVIFFDELDSLAPARGASGDSGGVMDRVVSQMLAAVDDLSNPAKEQNVFVIGATNRPDLIDRALLRPGRFDKLLYVGIDSDPVYRERILKALTRKFKLHEDVSLLAIAKRCPTNFTGADLYALCADAWFCAAKRKVSGLQPNSPTASNEDEEVDKNDSKSVVVEYDDFVKVLEDLTPSLSPSEIRNYEMLREQFEGPLKTQ